MPGLAPIRTMNVSSDTSPNDEHYSAAAGSDLSSPDSASMPDRFYPPALASSPDDDLGPTDYGPSTEADDDEEEDDEDEDDEAVIPKVEPQDDTDLLADIKDDSGSDNLHDGLAITTPARRRGRPRKEVVVQPLPPKTPKPRSKTGCMTCRKRKKKCDEAKPGCMSKQGFLPIRLPPLTSYVGENCKKNGVICEGYPVKSLWKSGKQKSPTCMYSSTSPQLL